MSVDKENLYIDAVRNVFKAMLYLDIADTPYSPLIITHPVFESGVVGVSGGKNKFEMLDIYNNADNLEKARQDMMRRVEKAQDVDDFLMWIRKPYKFTFLKYIKDYIPAPLFSRLLGEVWVYVENGNHDINVSKRQLVSWFRNAVKSELMSEEEMEYFNNLPEEIEVYRGVNGGKTPKGLSWTEDYELAKWFAERFNAEGSYIIKGKVKKADVLAYFCDRENETELIIEYSKVYDKEEIYENEW